MKMESNFEIVKIAEEYILVPVGDQMESFQGTVVLNDVSAYMLELMREDRTEKELVQLIMNEFDVDEKTAEEDVLEALNEMKRIGIIHV